MILLGKVTVHEVSYSEESYIPRSDMSGSTVPVCGVHPMFRETVQKM